MLDLLFRNMNNGVMDKYAVGNLWAPLHWLGVLEQQGSFTAAAARLGVSKAAVSQRIAELERVAGVPLVRRTTRSVQLTDAGRQLVHNTRDAFDQIAGSFSRIRDLAEEPGGLLRVTVPVAFARQQLLPRLPEFMAAYPDIRFELDLSDGSFAGSDGLIWRHGMWPSRPNACCGTLSKTTALLVASPDYLKAAGVPHTPDDLSAHRCLYYPRPKGRLTWTFEAKEAPAGRTPQRVTVPMQGTFAANNSEVLRDVAMAGLGVAVAPDFSVQAALRAGQLVEVLPDWHPVGAR